MKHAFLITAYKDPNHLTKLVRALSADNTFIFIHIDYKTRLDFIDFISSSNAPNIFIVDKPISVNWGGASHLKSINMLVRQAIASCDAERLHLISGSDYLIKPLKDLDSFFEQHSQSEFIEYSKLPYRNWHGLNENGGYNRLQSFHLNDIITPRTKLFKILSIVSLTIQKLPILKRRLPAEFLPLYGGSTWWSVTRGAAELYLKVIDRNAQSISHTFCSEEVCMHSIIMNSEYSSNVVNTNLRYIEWNSKERGLPATLDIQDYDKLRSSGLLFGRKFESPISDEIRERIDQDLNSTTI